MKTSHMLGLFAALFFCHCTHSTAPSAKDIARIAPRELGSGALQIKTEREEYSWRANELGAQQIIVATLTNTSNQTFYARLGDGFAGFAQEQLYIALGSHGHIEQWQAGANWREMPRGELIEGVRFVVVESKASYQLHADLHKWQGNESGEFRLRIDYFERSDPPEGATPNVDYSNVFGIAQ